METNCTHDSRVAVMAESRALPEAWFAAKVRRTVEHPSKSLALANKSTET